GVARVAPARARPPASAADRRNAAPMVAARYARCDALRHAARDLRGNWRGARRILFLIRGNPFAIQHRAVRYRDQRGHRLDGVAAFMQRMHGLSVAQVGAEFGVWALTGGVLGALVGGRLADRLQHRWHGGRVFTSGAGFVLGGPVCAALLLVHDLRWFGPLILATYFLYTWYNGPLVAVILDVVPPAVQASVLGAFVLFSHLAGDALAPPLIGY